MKRNKMIIWVLIMIAGLVFYWRVNQHQNAIDEHIATFTVSDGSIQNSIEANGKVQPQDRFEIKPPIAGRVDKILVKEGQYVTAGETLAIMSSSERATLLDAARLQGPQAIKEWEDVYKPFPLLAPVDGEVIVKSVHQGQMVSASDIVLVLSNRLIVKVQIDETDIGKVKQGQLAKVTLDAYPDITVQGRVDHIYFESKASNDNINLTVYEADIIVDKMPEVFRSGMSANILIIQQKKEHILMLPNEAVKNINGKSFVMIRNDTDNKLTSQEVQTGISDNINVEIVSGLTEGEKVYVVTQTQSLAPTSKSIFWQFTQ
jgi:macrolide-specific efflux system membrane fusion protein